MTKDKRRDRFRGKDVVGGKGLIWTHIRERYYKRMTIKREKDHLLISHLPIFCHLPFIQFFIYILELLYKRSYGVLFTFCVQFISLSIMNSICLQMIQIDPFL